MSRPLAIGDAQLAAAWASVDRFAADPSLDTAAALEQAHPAGLEGVAHDVEHCVISREVLDGAKTLWRYATDEQHDAANKNAAGYWHARGRGDSLGTSDYAAVIRRHGFYDGCLAIQALVRLVTAEARRRTPDRVLRPVERIHRARRSHGAITARPRGAGRPARAGRQRRATSTSSSSADPPGSGEGDPEPARPAAPDAHDLRVAPLLAEAARR